MEGFLDTPSFPNPQPQGLSYSPTMDLGVHEVPVSFCFS